MAEEFQTLKLGDTGAAVYDLQYRMRVLGYDIPDAEIEARLYGAGTLKEVVAFRTASGIRTGVLGTADREVMKAINEQFAKVPEQIKATLPAFDELQSDVGALAGGLGDSLVAQATTLAGIDNRLGDQTSILEALADKLVAPPPVLKMNASGEEVRSLHELMSAKPHLFIPKYELEEGVFGVGTREALLLFQAENGLAQTGVRDEATRAALEIDISATPTIQPRVEGRVTLENGQPAQGLKVRLYSQGLEKSTSLGDEKAVAAKLLAIDEAGYYTVTDDQGFYAIPYELGDAPANFVVALENEKQPQVLFGAKPYEQVDLVVPANIMPSPSEYERLNGALEKRISFLGERENDTFQVFSFLGAETGLDITHIDFVAMASKLSQKTKIPDKVFYALFREGLPTELPVLLAQSPTELRRALEAAVKDNILEQSFIANLDTTVDELQALGERLPEALIFKQPSFIFQPSVLYDSLTDTSALQQEQKDFIAARLNEHLRTTIVDRIGQVSEPMARAIQWTVARVDYQQWGDSQLGTVIQEGILAQIKTDTTLASETAEIEARLGGAPSPIVSELLKLDVAVRENPIFGNDIQRARTLEFAGLAGVPELVSNLPDEYARGFDASEAMLARLMQEGILKEDQTKELRLVYNLGNLSGDNLELMRALKAAKVKSIVDLVDWDMNGWQQLIKDNNIPILPGETLESYAANMMANLERTLPSQVLLSRLTVPEASKNIELLDSLNGLLEIKENEKLIDGTQPAQITWAGIPEADSEVKRQALQELTAFANTYRHLEIAELVNDQTLDVATKQKAVQERVQLLTTFKNNNPNLDLRLVNFFADDDTGIDWKDIGAAQPQLRKQLMSYQRVLNLADDPWDREFLLKSGMDSFYLIGSKTEREFWKMVAASTVAAVDSARASVIWAGAREKALVSFNWQAAVRDAVWGNFNDLAVNNVKPVLPELINELRKIDGFDDLFGRQDFCECEECRSVLSPAAYFVDLMYFIDKHVTQPVFADRANEVLSLRNRRQDLWELQLTCDNTNIQIPYLTIVNEVLEVYCRELPEGDIFAHLAAENTALSFSMPFNLPLEEARIYLGHFDITLHDIYRKLKEPEPKVWRARLDLSRDEYAIITTPNPGIVGSRFGAPSSLADFDVQEFIRRAGISRQQLDELLALRFTDILREVTVAKKEDPNELQNFPEILQNLTQGHLDFVHRMVRLWRKTGWTIPELDLVLNALKQAGVIHSPEPPEPADFIDDNGAPILAVAKLVDIQARLKLTVEELCVLVHDLPVSREYPQPPAKQADRLLYERLFDLKKLFGESNATTHEVNLEVKFHHYSLNRQNPNDRDIDSNTPVLLGGLGISETELLLLADLLKVEMPFDTNGNTELNRHTISLLYRHARLAKALKLTVEELIFALRLNFSQPNQVVTTIAQVQQLIEFRDWLKTLPFAVAELRLILTGEESNSAKHTSKPDVAQTLVQNVRKLHPATIPLLENDTPGIIPAEAVEAIVRSVQKSQALGNSTAVHVGVVKDILSQIRAANDDGKVRDLRKALADLFAVSTYQLDIVLEKLNFDLKSDDIRAAFAVTFTAGAPDAAFALQALRKVITSCANHFRAETLHDSLSSYFLIRRDELDVILGILNTRLTHRDIQKELVYTFVDGQPTGPGVFPTISDLMQRITRQLKLKLVGQIVQTVQAVPVAERAVALGEFLTKFFSVAPEQLDGILKSSNTSLGDTEIQTSLNTTFTNGRANQPEELSDLLQLLNGIASAIRLEAVTKIVLEVQTSTAPKYVSILRNSLAKSLNITDNQLDLALKSTKADLNNPAIQTSLATPFTNGRADRPAELNPLVELLTKIESAMRLKMAGKIVLEVQTSPVTDKVSVLRELIAQFTSVTVEQLDSMFRSENVDLNDTGIQTSLATTFTNGQAARPEELNALAELLTKIESAMNREMAGRIVLEVQASAFPYNISILRDSLAQFLNITVDQLDVMAKSQNIDLNDPSIQTSLATTFTERRADQPAALDALLNVVKQLAQALRFEALQAQLATSFNITPKQLEETQRWIGAGLQSRGIRTSLNTTFIDTTPASPGELTPLLALMQNIERIQLLFGKLKFSPDTVAYLTEHSGALGIADRQKITLDGVKALAFYRKLTDLGDEAEQSVQALLNSEHGDLAGQAATLAALFKQDLSLINSLINSLPLPPAWLDALRDLWEGISLCQTLGVNGYSLQKLAGDAELEEVKAARDVALGAFSSKYDDEKIRREKLEPYQDKINVIKRDAMCDYIIAREKDVKFSDKSDLYAWFLLDVEMGDCFRTSRVVCANASLQLYVHRILVNLEQSESGPFSVLNAMAQRDEQDLKRFRQEWEWRKNYRVWEANRKVFLYPENNIEPDLRDNKSPIFRELEDELLQKKVTKESAEAAYTKYIAQFAELAQLRIAGSYYDSDSYTYYFFARTSQDSPQYYYRTWNDSYHWKWLDKAAWTPWEKIDLAIASKRVTALVHNSKLYLFWSDVKAQNRDEVKSGNASTIGHTYIHTISFSYLDENGKWAPARKVHFHTYEVDDVTEDQSGNFSEVCFPHKLNNEVYLVYCINYYKYDDPKPAAVTTITKENGNGFHRSADKFTPNYDGPLPDKFAGHIQQDNGRTDQYHPQIHQWTSFLKTLDLFRCVTGQAYFSQEIDLDVDDSGYLHSVTLPSRLEVSKDTPLVEIAESASPRRRRLTGRFITTGQVSEAVLDCRLSAKNHFYRIELPLTDSTELTSAFDQPAELLPVGNAPGDYVFTIGDQQYLLKWNSIALHNPNDGYAEYSLGMESRRYTNRISTSLAGELGEVLADQGLIGFLSLDTQKRTEPPIGIDFKNRGELEIPYANPFHIDFRGAYGQYYQELFFHIPFLIANHLNANQKFEEAKWWYERIFDPTAAESPDDQNPTDRNWRYIEFRNQPMETLREILTNAAAIEQYKADPFNPHAIARLRPNAYQKAIVMKYIDNLLDWGDSLFTQDTRESINEATMLYVLAADILGKRPVRLGKCETASDAQLTYTGIGPAIDQGSEFLISIENLRMVSFGSIATGSNALAVLGANYRIPSIDGVAATSGALGSMAPVSDAVTGTSLTWWGQGNISGDEFTYRVPEYWKALEGVDLVAKQAEDNFFPFQFVSETVAGFCIPPNADLLEYWTRVEDRLFKIRHCMNISGVRRTLALFQPPIDPMALVRAKAAGLSLDDILAMLDAPLPPYRFSYLIEKAKQFTQTVQSFGSALLSALEKKDGEELTLLRSVHERNILRMTREIKKRQIEEAEYQYNAMLETKTNVEKRINYYQGLIDAGLNGWESTQQGSKHAATALKIAESAVHLQAAISFLIPQVGSPFAMKYGGVELGNSGTEFAQWTSSMAAILDAVSASAGLEATFHRREQEWKQQLSLAQQELKQVDQQQLAAEIRKLIAEKDLEIHEKNMEHADELHDFYKDKFTNLGLYTYLATTLNRLYREAYNVALDLARMAERTYQFERDDSTVFIAPDNWQADRAGLLAGERLLLQLQRMEKAYIERHTRDYEVTQSYSLALWNPAQLMQLRQNNSCEFEIPEEWFNLSYPGQYRRLIKSVRVTIPCVAGPYTNISAKLTLQESGVRKAPTIEPGDLLGVPNQKLTSIATSNAQNDGGLFELNFRDERYLPFEGAGAISKWRLELPTTFRLFDYDTISDVIVHVSYTAKDDGVLKEKVEEQLLESLNEAAAGGLYRLISLRHEFPNAYHKLLGTPGVAQSCEFELTDKHFPHFLAGKTKQLSETTVFIMSSIDGPPDTAGVALEVNDAVPTWNEPLGNLAVGNLPPTGSLSVSWSIECDSPGLDREKIKDVLLLLRYTIQ